MKNSIFYSSILMFFLFISAGLNAQKLTKEVVSTRYLSFPNFDVQNTDMSGLSAIYSIGSASFEKPELHDHEEVCALTNGKGDIKDVQKVKLYFYSIIANFEDSYLLVKDNEGNYVFGSKLEGKRFSGEHYYGYEDKCKYWNAQLLESDYKDNKSSWELKKRQAVTESVKTNFNDLINTSLYVSYVPRSVTVYSGKGKSYDYSEMDAVQSKAIAIYKEIAKTGITQSTVDKMTPIIQVWEKYVGQMDETDKKAMINKKLGKRLLANLANAYFFCLDYDKSIEYANLAGESGIARMVNNQKMAAEKNPNLSMDLAARRKYALNTKSSSLSMSQSNDALWSEYNSWKFKQDNAAKVNQAVSSNPEAANNPYLKYVTESQFGMVLNISMLDEKLSTLPVEVTQLPVVIAFLAMNNLNSIPKEIGNMKTLTKLDLSNNQISEIPAEIGGLENLEVLNLSKNPIASLPDSIKNLKKLKTLRIKSTKMSSAEISRIEAMLPSVKVKY